MATLNRNRYRIAELIQKLTHDRQRAPHVAALDACEEAGLGEHRLVTDDGPVPCRTWP